MCQYGCQSGNAECTTGKQMRVHRSQVRVPIQLPNGKRLQVLGKGGSLATKLVLAGRGGGRKRKRWGRERWGGGEERGGVGSGMEERLGWGGCEREEGAPIMKSLTEVFVGFRYNVRFLFRELSIRSELAQTKAGISKLLGTQCRSY